MRRRSSRPDVRLQHRKLLLQPAVTKGLPRQAAAAVVVVVVVAAAAAGGSSTILAVGCSVSVAGAVADPSAAVVAAAVAAAVALGCSLFGNAAVSPGDLPLLLHAEVSPSCCR